MGGRFRLGMGGRLHVGRVAAFASEWVAGFARNPHPLALTAGAEDRDRASLDEDGELLAGFGLPQDLVTSYLEILQRNRPFAHPQIVIHLSSPTLPLVLISFREI